MAIADNATKPTLLEKVVPTTTKATEMEYVDIPEVDIYDYPFQGVMINELKFPPGRHFVTKELAKEINEILARWEEQDKRLMRPNKDKRALRAVAQYGRSQSASDKA
jgi:hypothetical protein